MRDRIRGSNADEDNPYEGEALERYPEWWRRNVATFRAHGMRHVPSAAVLRRRADP